jgi:hypothetical protein
MSRFAFNVMFAFITHRMFVYFSNLTSLSRLASAIASDTGMGFSFRVPVKAWPVFGEFNKVVWNGIGSDRMQRVRWLLEC